MCDILASVAQELLFRGIFESKFLWYTNTITLPHIPEAKAICITKHKLVFARRLKNKV